MSAEPVARLHAIEKRFGATVALDGASLSILPGEVHGVLGENGAGKTTLLEVLGGLLRPDGGTIELHGEPVRLTGARDAWRRGVGMVHQHFTLVPRLSVLENLALGLRWRRGGLGLPLREVRARLAELRGDTGLDVPLRLDALVEELGVGARQRVEILKVLLRDPGLLVLDEPTAVLAPPEVERLLDLLAVLAGEGRAVVLVAHKLDEILRVADRVTVLRQGRTVLTAARSEVDATILTRAMVGSERPGVGPRAGRGDAAGRRADAEGTAADRGAARAGEVDRAPVVARLDEVRVEGPGKAPLLDGVSITVRRGEIVGVAGVEGNGQRELARVLAGRRAPDTGLAAVPADPGFIPQDRRRAGLVLEFDLVENLALALHRDPSLRAGPFLRWKDLRDRAVDAIRRYEVRAPGPWVRAGALSGGNQQRVVVARELDRSTDLLVAENPTRGLDVAGESYVHARLSELARKGPDGSGRPAAVVLISTDLDEVLALADRIFVMVRGRLLPVPPGKRDREGVGALMLSGST